MKPREKCSGLECKSRQVHHKSIKIYFGIHCKFTLVLCSYDGPEFSFRQGKE